MPIDSERLAEPLADARRRPSTVSTRSIVRWILSRIWRFWRPKPIRLKIVGIEVVQAVQRFNFTEGSSNNSVPLVAHKRTMARLYVESGMAPASHPPTPHEDRDKKPPYNFAAHGELPNVTGTLKLSSSLDDEDDAASAGGIGGLIRDVVGIGGRSVVDPGPPINANEVVTARPLDRLDRNDLRDSLNFVLPVEALSGQIRLTAEVHLKAGVLGLLLPRSRASTVVEFHERRLPVKFVTVLVNNYMAPAPPMMSYYYYCLDQVIAQYPAPDADFFPLYQLPGYETIENDSDLRQGWGGLADQLNQIEAGFKMDGYLLTALLAPSLFDAWRAGEAHPSELGLEFGPLFFTNPDTFAHELGHHFRLGHADGGNPEVEGDEDQRIPVFTDEPGIDMSKRALIPRGSTETMSYVASSPAWFSTETWKILFDSFAP